jgi:hypothetical protein
VEQVSAEGNMAQRNVEIAVGKLVLDEDARRAFTASPAGFLEGLKAAGLAFTAAEEEALRALDPRACARFAGRIDPRIRKLSLLPPTRVRQGRPRG